MAYRNRVLIIVNPAAGRSWSARRRVARVAAALRQRTCVVVRRESKSAADAERLARDAEPEFDVIVAAGGDGTINAVANGLAGTARPLALLPCGTANVLARNIGMPRSGERIADLILSGSARPVWPGRIGDRLFLAMASSGFDAEVVAAVNARLKLRTGRFAFVWGIARALSTHRPCELVVRTDGAEHRAAGVIATKGRFYAGSFLLAPAAQLDEAVLDLLLFRSGSRLALLRYLAALVLGQIPRRKDVLLLRCSRASVRADHPVRLQADGELLGQLPAEFGIAERPLWLVHP